MTLKNDIVTATAMFFIMFRLTSFQTIKAIHLLGITSRELETDDSKRQHYNLQLILLQTPAITTYPTSDPKSPPTECSFLSPWDKRSLAFFSWSVIPI